MVTSCSTWQKEEKECRWVKYLIYTVSCYFKFVVIYAFFPGQICNPKISEFTKKCFFPSLLNVIAYSEIMPTPDLPLTPGFRHIMIQRTFYNTIKARCQNFENTTYL